MPDRRMLAKSIIDTDAFSDMPLEAQMLYIRLNLAADDDGFVSNPRSIMRMHGFGDDNMKLLIAKKFVLAFHRGDEFVYLIKHWKIHNYIQKDRYKASNFREILRDVYLDENRAYSTTPGEGKRPALPASAALDTDCIQDVSEMDTQVRLGKSKDRLSKEREGKDREEDNKSSIPSCDGAEKEAHLAETVKLIASYKRLGYDPTGIYQSAEQNYGLTRSEIDAALEGGEG